MFFISVKKIVLLFSHDSFIFIFDVYKRIKSLKRHLKQVQGLLKPTKRYFLKIIDEIFLNEKGSGRGIYRKEGFNNYCDKLKKHLIFLILSKNETQIIQKCWTTHVTKVLTLKRYLDWIINEIFNSANFSNNRKTVQVDNFETRRASNEILEKWKYELVCLSVQ